MYFETIFLFNFFAENDFFKPTHPTKVRTFFFMKSSLIAKIMRRLVYITQCIVVCNWLENINSIQFRIYRNLFTIFLGHPVSEKLSYFSLSRFLSILLVLITWLTSVIKPYQKEFQWEWLKFKMEKLDIRKKHCLKWRLIMNWIPV